MISILLSQTNQEREEVSYLSSILVMCFLEYVLLEKERQDKLSIKTSDEQILSKEETIEYFEQLLVMYIDSIHLCQKDRNVFNTIFSQQLQLKSSLKSVLTLHPLQQNQQQFTYEMLWKKFHYFSFLSHRYKWLDLFTNYSISNLSKKEPLNVSSTTSTQFLVPSDVSYMKKMEGLLCSTIPRNDEKIMQLIEQKLADLQYKHIALLCYGRTNR
jgi:hypothetical protein